MRRAYWGLVVVGVACTSLPEPDAGANQDAGSGADSGSRDDAWPTELQALSDELAVHLRWDAGATSEEWLVFRDGDQLAQLDATARSFDDFGATAGSLTYFDSSATIDLPDGIELEWSVPATAPGPLHRYWVRSLSGTPSNGVSAARHAPRLTGFTVERGDAGWSFDAGTSLWLDTNAAAPVVFVSSLSAAATPNDQTTSVVLQASADAGRTLIPVTYKIIAHAFGAPSVELTVTGSRGGNLIEYQWQRSSDDSPTTFVDLPHVHGLRWLDPEAILSEGRYYRVAARAAGQEWLSAPVRSELRAPAQMISNGNGRNALVLRDDGVSFSLRYPRPAVQFPPLETFFSFQGLACGLLHDAGIVCDDGAGGLTPLNLPPAQSVAGVDGVLWLGLLDGGIDSYEPNGSGLRYLRRANFLEPAHIVGCNESTVCAIGVDGGTRCAFPFSGPAAPIIDVSTANRSFWISRWGPVTSDEYGNTTEYYSLGSIPGTLPVEDAGYVNGSEDFNECGVRADGLVRCPGGEWRSFEPPVSAERYLSMHTGQIWRCGLTLDRRVRCLDEDLPHTPPVPPVKDLQVQDRELVALLETGLIDARGMIGVSLRESADDRFSALSRDWIGTNHRTSPARQCGLRADGRALCGATVTVPATSRYAQITSTLGLLLDGGVESFQGDAGNPWPSQPVMELVEHAEAVISCARLAGGEWSCLPSATLPIGTFASISLASATSGCGLTPAGKLRCWPDQPPSSMASRRYRHVYATPSHRCGTTLEGEVLCVTSTGTVLPSLEWNDFVRFEQSSNLGCGIRRDGTVACRERPRVGRPPWMP